MKTSESSSIAQSLQNSPRVFKYKNKYWYLYYM